MFKVTVDWLTENMTARGGYTHAQIALLGEPWPPMSGWKDRAAGREISDEAKEAFEKISTGELSRKQQKELRSALGYQRRPLEERKAAREKRAARKAEKEKPVEPPQKTYFSYHVPDAEFAKSDAFLNSYEWRKLRMEVIKKYGARCQCCGATPEDGIKINVDHIKPRRTHPHLALDIRNLQVLCNPCNHGKGNWDNSDWRPSDDKISAEYSADAVSAVLKAMK